MSIANFGSFLGGMAQGQQNAENQRERAAYLAMLQKRQQAADDDVSSTRDAVFANNYMEGSQSTDPAAVFSGGLPPQQPPGQPPAPQPGQPSVPMQQPGPGGPPPQMAQPGAGPMPPQGPPPTPYAPPQAKPVIVPQGGGAAGQPAPGTQPMPQVAPGQGPQQGPVDGFAKAKQALDETKAALATPEAEQVAKDPKVQQATKQYHDYVKELSDAGIAPGKGKPDLVQMKRLQLLHDNLALASADASKHVSADRKVQYEFGTKYADLYAKQQASENVLKGREYTADEATARKRIGGAGSGAGGSASFESLSDDAKRNLAEDYQRIGPSVLPWSRSRGQGSDIAAFQNWMASNGYGASAGSRADYKADTKSLGALQQASDVQTQRYNTLDKNVDLMLKAAKDYGLGGNTLINDFTNKLRGTNDPKAKAFMTALATVQREYGKLADGGSGAAAAHVESLKNAAQTLGGNFTYAQLEAAAKVLKADGKNVLDAYGDQLKQVRQRAAGSRGSAPAAGSASGGGLYKAANGKTYTQDQINDAAAQKGEDPEKFAADRGLTRGN